MTTLIHAHLPQRHSLAAALSSIIGRLQHWVDVAEQRRQLARLDDHLLQDIGVDRFQARVEAEKAFWR